MYNKTSVTKLINDNSDKDIRINGVAMDLEDYTLIMQTVQDIRTINFNKTYINIITC